MASPKSKASKTSTSTSMSANAGVDASGKIFLARSVAGQVGSQLGKALVRGILGSMRR
jgi:hypothetical protein